MDSQKSFYGWKLIAALWVIYFINMGTVLIAGLAVSQIMSRILSMPGTTYGTAVGLAFVVAGLTSPIASLLVSRKGARYSMLTGTMLLLFGTGIMAFARMTGVLFIFTLGFVIAFGVSLSGVLPIQTIIANWFNRKRARAMGIVVTGLGAGGFVMPLIFGSVLEKMGNESWQVPWKITFCLTILSLVLIGLLIKNHPSETGDEVDGGATAETNITRDRVYKSVVNWEVKSALKTSSFWIIMFAGVALLSGAGLTQGFMIKQFKASGISQTVSFLGFALANIFNILGRLVGGALGDRIEPKNILSSGLLLFTISMLIMTQTSACPSVILFSLTYGIGYGMIYVCIFAIIANYYGTTNYQGIIGVLLLVMTILSISGPLLGGRTEKLIQAGHLTDYGNIFLFFMIISASAFLLSLFIRTPRPKNS